MSRNSNDNNERKSCFSRLFACLGERVRKREKPHLFQLQWPEARESRDCFYPSRGSDGSLQLADDRIEAFYQEVIQAIEKNQFNLQDHIPALTALQAYASEHSDEKLEAGSERGESISLATRIWQLYSNERYGKQISDEYSPDAYQSRCSTSRGYGYVSG